MPLIAAALLLSGLSMLIFALRRILKKKQK